MLKIIVTEWVSLDVFVSGPDNDIGFVGESFSPEMGIYQDAIVSQADTLILGRLTYESFAGAWPHVPDNPDAAEEEKIYARKVNAMRKLVFSRTLASADWNNSQLFREIDPAALNALKQQDGKDMLIYGSSSIVQQMTNLGLIDEYQLLVHPDLLAGGKPLFKDLQAKRKLKFVSARPIGSAVMLMTYQAVTDAEK
jgi:dihydrofolate reductase